MMAFSLFIGWMLILGQIRFETGYLLVACCCFVPAAAYLYGFLLPYTPQKDVGLVLTAVGWLWAAVVFFIQHSALQARLSTLAEPNAGTLQGGIENGALLFIILAVAFMAGGAILSYSAWNRERAALQNAYHDDQLRQSARRGTL